MKKVLVAVLVVALLVMGASAAWAEVAVPTIQIDDLQEGVDLKEGVTFSNFSPSNPSIQSSGVEWVAINGFLPNLGTVTRAAQFVEPPQTTTVSDIAILDSVAGNFVVAFASDDATNIDFIIPSLGHLQFPTFTLALQVFSATFKEPFSPDDTGDYETLFPHEADAGTLLIQARSDINAVPLPAAVLLLGGGLVRLAAYARRKRGQA